MTVVTDIVKFIRAGVLNHRQFQHFLETERDTDQSDVVYFCEVRWLCHSKVFTRVFESRNATQEFMKGKGKPVSEFDDPKWMADFAFLTDIPSQLNELNLKLQSKNQLVHILFKAFRMKLELFKCQLQDRNQMHFKTMLKVQAAENAPRYAAVISQLQAEFQDRFPDFTA